MAMNEKERNIVFDIREHIGVLNTYSNGWTKELNMVAWNESNPKYDIRDWDQNHQHMSKGITLHKDEMEKLYALLQEQAF